MQSQHNFCLLFKSLHVLKCDLRISLLWHLKCLFIFVNEFGKENCDFKIFEYSVKKSQNIRIFVRACLRVSNIFEYSFGPLFQYSFIPVRQRPNSTPYDLCQFPVSCERYMSDIRSRC